MPNARDNTALPFQNILMAGPTGSGKTMQIPTLPGRKFVYIFDPNALATLQGFDVEYEEFLPDPLEIDATTKGFNIDPKTKKTFIGDKPPSDLEPKVYIDWVEDINAKHTAGFFKDFEWICLDSMTFLSRAAMNRQLYVNGRYGKIEELADYRCVGSKLSDVMSPILALHKNIFMTGHINSFQDEKTKKIETMLSLPGRARGDIPLGCTNIWLARCRLDGKKAIYEIQTKPDVRGLQTIRTTIRGLKLFEDVTIKDFDSPEKYGIGAILTNSHKGGIDAPNNQR